MGPSSVERLLVVVTRGWGCRGGGGMEQKGRPQLQRSGQRFKIGLLGDIVSQGQQHSEELATATHLTHGETGAAWECDVLANGPTWAMHVS